MRPALPNANAVGQLTGDRVFYANAAADTDVLVGAHPTGFEVFFQLRSAASPETLPLAIEGAGLSLRRSSAVRGGAEVVRAGHVVAQIAPPTAVDAAKRPVPVAYRFSGTTLEVVAPHVKRKVQYPILVDPHVMDQQLWYAGPGYGIGGWQFETPWPNNFWGSQAGAYGPALYLVSGATNYYYGGGSWGWWRYAVPGTAHAFRADFYPVLHEPRTGGVCFTLGFWRGGAWSPGEGDNVTTGAEGAAPISHCAPEQTNHYRVCFNEGCAADHTQAGNSVGFQQWINGAGVRSLGSYTTLGGVTTFLEDYANAAITGGPSDNAAFGPDHQWSYAYTQGGLGVKQVIVDSPTDPLWDQAKVTNVSCWGTPWGRCSLSGGDNRGYGNLGYGSHQIRVRAITATGRADTGSGSRTWNVHIGYWWASWRWGGANHLIDSDAEEDALGAALATRSDYALVWRGLAPEDKNAMMGGFDAWYDVWAKRIDTVAPARVGEIESSEVDSSDHSVEISWTAGADPDIETGVPGSGSDGAADYRWRRAGGSWVDWRRTEDAGFTLTSANPGDVVDVEIRGVDRAGRVAPAAAYTVRVPTGPTAESSFLIVVIPVVALVGGGGMIASYSIARRDHPVKPVPPSHPIQIRRATMRSETFDEWEAAQIRNRRSLRRRLRDADELDPGESAHHVVAIKDRRAKYAREVLWRCGIDPNSPVNGVAVPGRYHQKMHTNDYYNWIDEVIRRFHPVTGGIEPCNLDFNNRLLEAMRDFKRYIKEGKAPGR